MKSNELRVGNWVNNNEEDYQITSATIAQLERGDSTAKPIPLTDEWLLRLGFKEYKDFGYKTKQFDLVPLQGFSYNLNTKKVMIMQKGDIQSHWLENEINYVHQLQNLYFALTGEELTNNGK